MAVPNTSVETLIICGNTAMNTKKFNEQTGINQVHEIVRQSFSSNLLNSYRIQYYDTATMLFVDLEDQLRNGINPFQSNSTTGVQDVASPPSCIHLFVVNNSRVNSNNRSATETQGYQILFDTADISSESNLSVNSNPTNDDVSQDNNEEFSSDTNEDPSTQLTPRFILKQNESNRLFFSLDVRPTQRDIYKSDQFNVRKQKSNGRIARVQGIKTAEQKMLQVLPRLRIPPAYLNSNATLLVAVVLEELNNGMRVWYKHPHKGFLPEQYTKDSKVINPISFNLNDLILTDDNDVQLSLSMVTKWDKTRRELEELHRFTEEKTVEIHPASNVEKAPRLLCVLQRNGTPDWNTFCLSDFIRSPKPPQPTASSVTTEPSSSPDRKRKKLDD